MTEGSLTLAVHQPNYIPWLGYFHKLAASDVFVYLDAVQFPRGQSFGARNRIKTPNGVSFLTVPVSSPKGRKGKATYREIEFAEPRWRDKHLKTVEMSYARAAHFGEVFDLYRQGLETGSTPVEVNVALIEAFANLPRDRDEARPALRAPPRVRAEDRSHPGRLQGSRGRHVLVGSGRRQGLHR